MVPPDVPPIFGDVIGTVIGLIAVVALLAALVGTVTLLRRGVRYCVMSWRNEGWGIRARKDEQLGDEPSIPVVEMAKTLLSATRPPAQGDPTTPDDAGQEKPAA